MKTLFFSCLVSVSVMAADAPAPAGIPNAKISYPLFVQSVTEVETVRESRRLTEGEFLRMTKEPGVVVLDARSAEKFRLRHITGAVNLSLPDFTAESLARVIPNKTTKVLIYCNNNFEGSPISLASKSLGAALNLHSFVALNSYGYKNVYELGPLLHVKTSRLPFAGTEVNAGVE